MAEPVSSIITIATVSLAIIKKTAIYIQEARVVDELVEKLLVTLLDLRRLIRVVESTCRKARSREDDPSRFVRESLTRCHKRLEEVQHTVEDLASRRSSTFLQKVALKIRSDKSKREIEEAIQDIERLMDQIHKGISVWNLHMTSVIDRRTSEALPVQQATAVQSELHQIGENESIHPLNRTWSDAETAYDSVLESPTRRTSSATQHSRPSICSISSQAIRTPSESNFNVAPDSEPEKPSNDWVDFHYQIKVCEGDRARVQAIKDALQQHPESSKLANSTDGSKRSPLHLAAQRGDIQLAEILLDFSADINARDSQPSSVLDLAVAHNKEDFVAFLLGRGVDETAISKQNSFRFEEIKEAIELRKHELRKPSRKSRKRTRSGTVA